MRRVLTGLSQVKETGRLSSLQVYSDAWAEVAPDLGSGNRGRADLIQIDSRGNVVHAPGKTVALLGVEDLVVVDTDDALLVCRTADAQRVREIIADIEKRNREDLL